MEYYLMNVDGASNHPLLSWGVTNYDPFIFPEPIEESDLKLPVVLKFRKPVPAALEMADILSVDGYFALSDRARQSIERMNPYGVQFFPAIIETDKSSVLEGYNVLHVWNGISAVDKDNYVGNEPNRYGNTTNLNAFSLDPQVLSV